MVTSIINCKILITSALSWYLLILCVLEWKENNIMIPLDCILCTKRCASHRSDWQMRLFDLHRYYSCCSVAKSCLSLCDPMRCSTPGFSVLHYLPEFAQIYFHWVMKLCNHFILCCPLLHFDFNLPPYQGLFQWVGTSHQGAKVLGLQHQSFQWIFSVDFL